MLGLLPKMRFYWITHFFKIENGVKSPNSSTSKELNTWWKTVLKPFWEEPRIWACPWMREFATLWMFWNKAKRNKTLSSLKTVVKNHSRWRKSLLTTKEKKQWNFVQINYLIPKWKEFLLNLSLKETETNKWRMSILMKTATTSINKRADRMD